MRVARGGAPGRFAAIARACADVYSEPGCASVMRDPPRRPEAITRAIAQACRDGPRLAAPRPTLCAMPELPPPVELGRRWRELQNRILALELEVAPDQIETLAPPMDIPVREETACSSNNRTPSIRAMPAARSAVRVPMTSTKSLCPRFHGPSAPAGMIARRRRR
jgi:hypothetical protein